MRLRITKRDIQKGVRLNAYKCPIAQAFKRTGVEGMVLPTTVRIDLPAGKNYNTYRMSAWANLSKKAEKFIEDFDNKKKVKPLTIILKFGDYA